MSAPLAAIAPSDTAPSATAASATAASAVGRPWGPLLEGPDADRAWEAIHAIAKSLEAPPSDGALPANLASGAAGQALFFAYLALATDDEHWLDVACDYLETMIEGAETVARWPSLHTGFSGLAWTLEHLQGRVLEGGAVDHSLDQRLLEILDRGPWLREYDLISGLVGFGVYALEILPRPEGRACLENVLNQLEATTDPLADGVTWHTDPRLLPEHQRRVFPDGYHNLGLAHGIPAILALLGALCAVDVEAERARRLLEPAVDWLLAHEGADDGACFAHSIAAGAGRQASRLAWCYGDPGVAVALLHAGRLADVPAWREEAYRIALASARRPEDEAGVVDAGLCHGSVGLAHLFHRIARLAERPLPEVEEAARRWARSTLEYRTPGLGFGGFRAYKVVDKHGPAGWRETRSFLEGSAGIGLGLLALVSDVEPAWDRVLMLSMRTPGIGDGAGDGVSVRGAV
ncbi:MAG: lanthionine synthetase C family protein [Acidobacteriota bacterium]